MKDLLDTLFPNYNVDVFNLIEETYGFNAYQTVTTNYYQTDSCYIIKVLLPGVIKSSLETEIKATGITVKGEFDLNVPAEAKSYAFNTPSSKKFSKVINLPAKYSNLRLNSVKATYLDGILTITIDKDSSVSTGFKVKVD